MAESSPYACLRQEDPSWDFRGEFTKRLTHGFHSYPAMMIPQVAARLVETYSKPGDTVLDPFCGSGSTLVEAQALGRNSWGIDLNPLALLVAEAKTSPIDPRALSRAYFAIVDRIIGCHGDDIALPSFFNIDFWFKPQVARQLARIKAAIDQVLVDCPELRRFFLVAFSEAVRLSSNSRSHEFKLFRYAGSRLEQHNPDAIAIFRAKVEKSIQRMADFYELCLDAAGETWCRPILADATKPVEAIADGSVDAVVTSPPYGDSRTTVAYGQFSRLSAQWLGFDDDEARNLDTRLMGGVIVTGLDHDLRSPSLDVALTQIADSDPSRARQVLSFYRDLRKALSQIARKVRPGGHLCMVIGNRRVKKVHLPTDLIIAELASEIGLRPLHIIVRNIPSKTMPLKNSPTNVPGELELTMHKEYIVTLVQGWAPVDTLPGDRKVLASSS